MSLEVHVQYDEREPLLQNERLQQNVPPPKDIVAGRDDEENLDHGWTALPRTISKHEAQEIAMSTGEYESDQRPIVDDGSYMDASGSYVEDAESQRSVSTQQTYEGATITQTIDSTLQSARLNMHGATGDTSSMMHLMKGMIGTGILAIPSAIQNAGLWFGVIGLLLIGAIATHCMHQLVNCSHELCYRLERPFMTYTDVAEYAFATCMWPSMRKFAKAAKITLNAFLCMTQFGFCIVYILFIAENIQEVVCHYTGWTMGLQAWETCVLALLIPFIFIRNLKALAPLSAFANMATWAGLIIIFAACFQDIKPVDQYPAISSIDKIPLYFGTAIYAFEGIGVVLPIENKMKNPEHFGGKTGVLNTAMMIVICLYAALGFYGYIAYGETIQASITLNLPHEWYYDMTKILFAVAIFITYLLQFYVPFGILWPYISPRIRSDSAKRYVEYGLRAVIVVFTFTLAAVIPHLDLMISLIGALASSAIALIFPPLLDILVYGNDGFGRFYWKLIKNILIIAFGFIGFVAGTGVTLVNIVDAFQNPEAAKGGCDDSM